MSCRVPHIRHFTCESLGPGRVGCMVCYGRLCPCMAWVIVLFQRGKHNQWEGADLLPGPLHLYASGMIIGLRTDRNGCISQASISGLSNTHPTASLSGLKATMNVLLFYQGGIWHTCKDGLQCNGRASGPRSYPAVYTMASALLQPQSDVPECP